MPKWGGVMKNRITILAENDKPMPTGVEHELLEKKVAQAWQFVFDMLAVDPDDRVTVEKVEVFE